jgi:hypothetical protein
MDGQQPTRLSIGHPASAGVLAAEASPARRRGSSIWLGRMAAWLPGMATHPRIISCRSCATRKGISPRLLLAETVESQTKILHQQKMSGRTNTCEKQNTHVKNTWPIRGYVTELLWRGRMGMRSLRIRSQRLLTAARACSLSSRSRETASGGFLPCWTKNPDSAA